MFADGLLLMSAMLFGLVLVPLRLAMASIGPFTFNAARFSFSSLVMIPVLFSTRSCTSGSASASGSHGSNSQSGSSTPQTAAASHSSSSAPSSRMHDTGAKPHSEGSSATTLSESHLPNPSAPKPRFLCMAKGDGLKQMVIGGSAVGLCLFLASTFLQMALVTIPASKAGFISELATVLTPLIGMAMGERTRTINLVAAFVAMMGLYLLSVTDDLSLAAGDGLALIGAVCWTAQFMVLDTVCGEDKLGLDPTKITLVQFLSNTLLCIVTAELLETVMWSQIQEVWIQVVASGVIEAAGFLFQAMGQRLAPAGHVALVMSLETAFAGIFGAWILGESLSSREGLGCAIMFLAVLLVTVPASIISTALGSCGMLRGVFPRHQSQPREA